MGKGMGGGTGVRLWFVMGRRGEFFFVFCFGEGDFVDWMLIARLTP